MTPKQRRQLLARLSAMTDDEFEAYLSELESAGYFDRLPRLMDEQPVKPPVLYSDTDRTYEARRKGGKNNV